MTVTKRRAGFLMLLMLLLGSFAFSGAVQAKTIKKSRTMYVGGQVPLRWDYPKAKKWKSSNKAVATVDKYGLTTGIKKGTTTITAKEGKTKYVIKLRVKAAPKIKKVPAKITMMSRKGKKQIYTNLDELDYLLEVIAQDAGVKAGMSDLKVVRRRYTYMAKKFVYYNEKSLIRAGYPFPRYYDGEALADKIEDFNKQKAKAVQAGWVSYSRKHVRGGTMEIINFSDSSKGEEAFADETTGRLEYRLGVCDDHAAVFALLCEHLGIKAGIASGTVNGNPHAWSWAKIGGKKYYFDTALAIHEYADTKKVTYGYFKMTKKNMKGSYKKRSEW